MTNSSKKNWFGIVIATILNVISICCLCPALFDSEMFSDEE